MSCSLRPPTARPMRWTQEMVENVRYPVLGNEAQRQGA